MVQHAHGGHRLIHAHFQGSPTCTNQHNDTKPHSRAQTETMTTRTHASHHRRNKHTHTHTLCGNKHQQNHTHQPTHKHKQQAPFHSCFQLFRTELPCALHCLACTISCCVPVSLCVSVFVCRLCPVCVLLSPQHTPPFHLEYI